MNDLASDVIDLLAGVATIGLYVVALAAGWLIMSQIIN